MALACAPGADHLARFDTPSIAKNTAGWVTVGEDRPL